MIRSGLRAVNLGLAGLIALLLASAAYYSFSRPTAFETPDVIAVRHPLPRRAFEQLSYNVINQPFTALQFAPATMQLPDLRKKLIYYGKNSRPDATENQTFMHFDFLGRKEPVSIQPGEKLYLSYKPTGYIFSPENRPTSLWLVGKPDPKGALVSLRMRGEGGEEIAQPESHSQFVLAEKEYNRFAAGSSWQLGSWRVDGSLFARQRARWYGKDEFFSRYGGPEYAHVMGKERIDFGEGDEAYSVFVEGGDALVWEEDRWVAVKPGKDSLGKPLLVVKKIEDRIMNCELWDTEGKSKIILNLLRCMEAWIPHHLEKSFRFVGAHTRSQFAFELNKKRVVLAPDDWLVFTPKGWMKLETPKEIDDYVQRKVTGPLFVFEGVGRKDDKQVLIGTMFNASRTEAKEVELAMVQGTLRGAVAKAEEVVEDEDDFDDDEDFEDDDDDDYYGDEIYPDPAVFGMMESD